MFKKTQLIRQYIFIIFAALILLLSSVLIYYTTFFEENKPTEALSEPNHQISKDKKIICEEGGLFDIAAIYGSFFFKLSAAFFAGSVFSDKIFIKIGII